MNKENDEEGFLREFSARPVPPQIGQRILRQARLRAAAARILTPGLGLLFIASLFLGAIFVIIDTALDGRQQRALEAELNWTPKARISPDQKTNSEIAEMMAEFPELKGLRQSWIKWSLSYREEESSSDLISVGDIKEKTHEH